MGEKGLLETLLKAWQAPDPRPDFETRVLRRLHSQPVRISVWQRWVIEPMELTTIFWRQQTAPILVMASMALVLAIGLALANGSSANRTVAGEPQAPGVNAFSTFPEGSVSATYWEIVRR